MMMMTKSAMIVYQASVCRQNIGSALYIARLTQAAESNWFFIIQDKGIIDFELF